MWKSSTTPSRIHKTWRSLACVERCAGNGHVHSAQRREPQKRDLLQLQDLIDSQGQDVFLQDVPAGAPRQTVGPCAAVQGMFSGSAMLGAQSGLTRPSTGVLRRSHRFHSLGPAPALTEGLADKP